MGELRWRRNPFNGYLFSDRNVDGVFREENTMLPMLAIAVTVAIWSPITVVACKWIVDA